MLRFFNFGTETRVRNSVRLYGFLLNKENRTNRTEYLGTKSYKPYETVQKTVQKTVQREAEYEATDIN